MLRDTSFLCGCSCAALVRAGAEAGQKGCLHWQVAGAGEGVAGKGTPGGSGPPRAPGQGVSLAHPWRGTSVPRGKGQRGPGPQPPLVPTWLAHQEHPGFIFQIAKAPLT